MAQEKGVAPRGKGSPREGISADSPDEEKGLSNAPLTFVLKVDPDHPYLRERGLADETVAHFGLGYAPRGLMKGRIAIPIHNEKGELIAYAGRWPGDPPEGEPKYKLPPGFKKHLVLYNLHRAIPESPEGKLLQNGNTPKLGKGLLLPPLLPHNLSSKPLDNGNR